MMKIVHSPKIVWIAFFLLSAFFSYAIVQKTIVIGITYDLQFAIDSVVQQFVEDNPNIKVRIERATNNELYFQAKDFDVVIFSELDYAKILAIKNVVEKDFIPIGYGHVALLANLKKMDAGKNDVKGILLYDEINSLTIPKKAISTYGKMAIEYLNHIRATEYLGDKIKLRDTDIIIGLIAKGKLDFAIIPYSLCFSKKFSSNNVFIPLPTNDYTPNLVVATVIKHKKNIDEAHLFVHYLKIPSVNAIFKYFGYTENPQFL
ncbi:MAG: molybdate ABC transporter substrate-binding protein [Chitinophagaceae bacterium]